MSPRLSRLLLGLVLALSAWIQFTMVERTVVEAPLSSDAHEYFFSAYNLVHYGVYSSKITWPPEAQKQPPPADALRPPGYPLFLVLVGNPMPSTDYLHKVVLVQAVLGVLSVWLMYLISASFLPPSGALVATVLTAISPHLMVIGTYVLTESLFVVLVFASTYSLILALPSKQRWRWLLAGVLWGLAALVRPTVLFLPVLLLLGACLPRYRGSLKPAALLFAGFLLVQTPWWLRNASLPDRPAEPSRMVAFLNFGSYPDFVYPGRPESYGFPERFDPQRARNERDLPSVLAHIASRFREQPATYLRWTLIGKPEFFLSWTNIDGPEDVLIYSVLHIPLYEDPRFRALWEFMLDLHWPLMLLGLSGALIVLLAPSRLGIGVERQRAAQIVAGVFAYALIFHMIGAPLPRYGIPFRPLLYPMALLLALSLWPRRSHDAPRQSQSN